MQLFASAIAILFALVYFGFYGFRIGDVVFWCVLATGLVPMIIDVFIELKRPGV